MEVAPLNVPASCKTVAPPCSTSAPVKVFAEVTVQVLPPSRVTLMFAPLMPPAQVWEALKPTSRVAAVELLLMMAPPVPGSVPTLLRLATAWLLPLRSSVPPRLTCKT